MKTPFGILLAALMASALITPVLTQEQQVPDNIAAHPAPEQPLAYSHKQHIDLGLVCEACHTNPDPGILMSFPPTAMCTSCHAAGTGNVQPLAALDASVASGEPISWVRVYQIMDGITWGHRSHTTAGLACEACHGDVGQSEAMAEETAVAAMASCISCHNAHEAEANCNTCHAWPTDELLRARRD